MKAIVTGWVACAVSLGVLLGLLQYACARPLLRSVSLGDPLYAVKIVGPMVLLAVTTLVGSMISLALLRIRTWIIGAAWVGVIEWVVAGTIWHYVTTRGDGRFAFVIAVLTLELVAAAIWAPQRNRGGIT